MKIVVIFKFVYLSVIKVHNNFRNQLLDKIQEKLESEDYACLNLDDHYVIHFLQIDRSDVLISRYNKHENVTQLVRINIQKHLDENLNLKDTIKQAIIRILYLFGDKGLKYLCILDEDFFYKNENYIYNFLKNIPSYIYMIKHYDESKREYLEYQYTLRNYISFICYPACNLPEFYEYSCQYYDKESFYLNLLRNEKKLVFFKFDLNTLNMSEYFRFYYINFKRIPEAHIDTLLKFVKNFNFELHEIDHNFKFISKASENFIRNKNSMQSENTLLTRKMDLEIKENHMIWNSVCFSTTENANLDENLDHFRISYNQLEEIKKFYREINEIKLNDLMIRSRLINLLKGSDLYRIILENLLSKHYSGKGLILINILYSLAIITKSQFKDYLYNRSIEIIDFSDILNQINCHYASVRYSLFNMLLYSELEDIASTKKESLMFFTEFNQLLSIRAVKELMNLTNMNNLTILEKLHVFIDTVYYKPDLSNSECNLKHSSGIPFFVCKLLRSRLIVDNYLDLGNTKDYFEEDYVQLFYDRILHEINN